MASTGEGEGWQVQASPMGPAGKGPGWEDERMRVGQDKGPAPHLTTKGAGHHLHDKEKSLSIWAGPKGDLPTAFEVGSRAGRGLGSPRRFPQVRSSAGTGPWGQPMTTRCPGQRQSQEPGHPFLQHRAPAAATATLHVALSPRHTLCPSHTHHAAHRPHHSTRTHTLSTSPPQTQLVALPAHTHTAHGAGTFTWSLQHLANLMHTAWMWTQLLPCTHTHTQTIHRLSHSQPTLSWTATAPHSHPCTFETLSSNTPPKSWGSLALSILPSGQLGTRTFQPYKPSCQCGRTAPILSPCHPTAPQLFEHWVLCQGQAELAVPLAVPMQAEPQSRIQPCRTPSPGILRSRAFLTVVAGAGNAAPHPLVWGASLGIRGELRD